MWRFGIEWLGRDPQAGERITQSPQDAAATSEPRRYGFHATLKPPFALAEGRSSAELEDAIAEFAAGQAPFDAPGLCVSRLGRFVALVPRNPSASLDALAGACVRVFDRFRAPATADEIARRQRAALTPRQADYLAIWGYPYVFEEFRFHMTLTGPLQPAVAETYLDRLGALAAPVLAPQLAVREIALFVEPGAGEEFRLLRRFELGSTAARR